MIIPCNHMESMSKAVSCVRHLVVNEKNYQNTGLISYYRHRLHEQFM